MRILTVILTALCLVPQAQAQCGRTFYPSYYQPTYHAPYYPPTVIVEKQVYVASFVPVVSVGFAAQAVTPYNPAAVAAAPAPAAYAAPAAPAAPVDSCAATRAALEELKAEFRAFRQQRQLPAPQAAPPAEDGDPEPLPPPKPQATQAGPHPGLAVLAARCASCHTEGRLKAGVAKGGGFPLFARDGKTALVLSSDQAVRTWRACRGGTMPPGGKWQDEDLAKVEDLLFGKRP